MVKTEAQKRAARKYEAKAKQICVKFYPPDHDLYEWVKAKASASGYIKELIRQDRAKDKAGR